MNISAYKSNTTVIPTYNDGYFDLYEIYQKGTFPKESIKLIQEKIPFEECSVGDKLKYELKSRNVDIDMKIKIREEKSIDSKKILEINNILYKVVNVYHFTDNDGFKKTRISLGKYVLVGEKYGFDKRKIG